MHIYRIPLLHLVNLRLTSYFSFFHISICKALQLLCKTCPEFNHLKVLVLW